MAARAERRFEDLSGSRTTEGETREVEYVVLEATTAQEALDIAERDAALTEDGLLRNGVRNLTRANDSTWYAVVSYVKNISGLPDPALYPGRTGSFQFETGGGRRTINRNISSRQVSSRSVYAVPYTEAELGPFINADDDGVRGVEIESSVFRFSVSKAWSPFELPPGYVAKLYDYTNCYNSKVVNVNVDGILLAFKIGELLFLGASGTRDDDGLWKITYNFAAQKNLPAGTVIGDLTPFAKDVLGWSYLEIRTFTTTECDPKIVVHKPRAAIEHEVYESRDLNLLGV